MATQAHCAYAFECLAAHFDHRQPLSLAQVVERWSRDHPDNTEDVVSDEEGSQQVEGDDDDDNAEMTDAGDAAPSPPHPTSARSPAFSRLLHRSRGGTKDADSAASSASSLPSTTTSASTPGGSAGSSGADTPATSHSSLSSPARSRREPTAGIAVNGAKYPLFVTWNVVNRSGSKTLRGCIGTFEPQHLEAGLRSYALTSALEDTRFPPIPPSLLPALSAHITLLTNFSTPTPDPLDWTLGTHGLRITFTHGRRRLGATYLPDVAREQGWSKEEAVVSLMRKAGWRGRDGEWKKTWKDGGGELVRYEGLAVGLGAREWREWREGVK